MNIVFFGTSEFALPSIEALIKAGHRILAVVTQPDRPRGRDLKLSPPPAKVLALTKGIPVFQPADASDAGSADHLKKLGADLFVVISFGQILKNSILSIPKLCAVNVHGSLLPKYRGAAPTNWAIINGDEKSGVTVIKMNEKMDEGDIVLKREIAVDEGDTNVTLTDKLSGLGAEALIEAIGLIAAGKMEPEKQDGAKATYAPKLKKEDGLIDWNESAAKIHNKVRGFVPWPGAYTYYDGKILKVLKTELSSAPAEGAGSGQVADIIKGKGIIVNTGNGMIAIQYLQLEGKKPLDADSFIRGHRIARGYKFSAGRLNSFK
ncbi:MAG: methionyl-tRNA formyltransferase [Candidatus Omnitrophica bacterium]|nr:methionyl-tRNA formyltransferase [Candidatus Omnitrophota bacterium]